ncbi:hypothetical protein [Ralstonia sp. UBA689]|uniref:hypothetical protein n=1 Tax=Ralstonia sp. UBA689 TaxID=1947373 RepID=UPI0025DF98F1|nr:hypothetical protein [Ralstonia sp. UBA689]
MLYFVLFKHRRNVMRLIRQLPGFVKYTAAIIVALAFHTFALHLDEEAQLGGRARIANPRGV